MPVKSSNPIPEGMATATISLYYNGNCKEAIEFYKKALGAELIAPPAFGEDGKSIIHSMMKIGDSNIMMLDAMPNMWETGPQHNATAGIWLYVKDCDELYNRAVKAGCKVIYEIMDAFWGDRTGKVKDPFGHCWSIATNKWKLTPEEMAEAQKEWMESVK